MGYFSPGRLSGSALIVGFVVSSCGVNTMKVPEGVPARTIAGPDSRCPESALPAALIGHGGDADNCSCTKDEHGDSRFVGVECLCLPRQCPRTIADAIDRLGFGCRPYLQDFAERPSPGTRVVERVDGCGRVEVTSSSGYETEGYIFDSTTGRLVGVKQFWDFCTDCGGCMRVAGDTSVQDRCPAVTRCRICGEDAASALPLCNTALACGVNLTTPRDERLFK
jgi:hypothetical protein